MATLPIGKSAGAFSGKTAGAVGLVITAILWGGNHVMIRSIADETTPAGVVFWRWTLTVAILLPMTAPGLWQNRYRLAAIQRPILVLGFASCVVFSFAIISAPFGTSATNVGLIQATSPLWVVIISLARGETDTGILSRIAVPLGFVGSALLILSANGHGSGLSALRWGDGAALLAAVIWAAYSSALRAIGTTVSPMYLFSALTLTGYMCLLPVLSILMATNLVQMEELRPAMKIWPELLYIGILATCAANFLWNRGVHFLGASTASQFLFLAPICSTVFSAIWLGERTTGLQALGAFVVMTSLAFALVDVRNTSRN